MSAIVPVFSQTGRQWHFGRSASLRPVGRIAGKLQQIRRWFAELRLTLMVKGEDEELAAGAGGTYVLVLRAEGSATVQIGCVGVLPVRRGHYLYVGSALGPGGLKARLGHHLRLAARPRWHIDYLRKVLGLREIWYACDGQPWESRWAQALAELPELTMPMPGFGASDRPGETHLFHSRRRPALARFRARLGRGEGGPVVRRLSVGETAL